MRHAAVRKFGQDIQVAVPAADIAASGTQTQWNDVIGSYNVFDTVFEHNLGFEETPDIADRIKSMMDQYMAIKHISDGFMRTTGATQTAAKHINFLLKPFKDLPRGDYYLKAGQLSELIQVLTKTENTSAVQACHLTEIVTDLSAQLAEFNTLYSDRSNLRQGWKDMIPVKEARRRFIKKFVKWEKAITLFYDVEELSDTPNTAKRTLLEGIMSKINAIIDQARLATAGRSGKGGSGSSGSGNKPKPDGPSGPSTDENRPEGVPPNEDSDEPGNGGDTPSDNGDTPSGGEDNTGGGSGNNNTPGGDKPPNPESPDRKKKKSGSKELDIDITIKEKGDTPEGEKDTPEGKKDDTKK
jgi:hypothetical protein